MPKPTCPSQCNRARQTVPKRWALRLLPKTCGVSEIRPTMSADQPGHPGKANYQTGSHHMCVHTQTLRGNPCTSLVSSQDQVGHAGFTSGCPCTLTTALTGTGVQETGALYAGLLWHLHLLFPPEFL